MIYKRLGDMLLAVEAINEEQLNKALEIQRKTTGKKLGEILIEQGFASQRQVYKALERQLGVEYVDLVGLEIPKEMVQLVPRSLAKKYNVVPVRSAGETLSLAMADPLNFVATEAIHMATRKKIVAMLATPEAITRTINDVYGSVSAEKALQDLKNDENTDTSSGR